MNKCTLKDNVKLWYMDAFPTDELGQEIKEDLTFEEVINSINAKEDVYEVIDVSDSIVRERIFGELVDILQNDGYEIEYDNVYYAWLGKSPVGVAKWGDKI